MYKTRAKQHNDKVDNLINLIYSSLRDIDYNEWNRIALKSSSVAGFDIDDINLLSYESKLLIEDTVGYFDNKIDTVGNVIINPIADVDNILIRTNVIVENYKNSDDSNIVFKNLIEGNDDNIAGFFLNYNEEYLVDNYNIFNTSYINLFSNRIYKNYSRLNKIPIYELLGAIYSTDLGILIGDNIITTNKVSDNLQNLVIDANDNINVNATVIELNTFDKETNSTEESINRSINFECPDIQIYGPYLKFNNLEVKNDKIIIRNFKDKNYDENNPDISLIYDVEISIYNDGTNDILVGKII